MAGTTLTNDGNDMSGPFWQAARAHKLLLQFDRKTGRAQFYPRPQSLYSEHGTEWREACGRGKLLALTLSRVAPKALEHLAPYALGLVQLEEGPRLLARIDAPYESLRIGQALTLAWDDRTSGLAGAAPIYLFCPAV